MPDIAFVVIFAHPLFDMMGAVSALFIFRPIAVYFHHLVRIVAVRVLFAQAVEMLLL